MVDVATLRTLLATVPPEFVSARNDLAKSLRAGGDRDGAEAVKALRRLGVADWALNVAAGERPDAAAALADAAVDVLNAQEDAMAGRGGGDLRDRMKTLRARSAELVDAAIAVAQRNGQRGTGSSSIDVGTRLSEIAANRAAVDLLRDGLLGAADPGVADPFGVVGAGRPEPATKPARGKAPSVRKKSAPASSEERPAADVVDRAELERRRAERQERADAERASKAAAAALTTAEAALSKARAVAAKAATRVAEAEARLAELAAARDEAEAALAAADDAHRDAVEEAERAQERLSR